ncbi:PIN domain-containing protein [Methylotenera sp.]|uniref:PIN domain-containing protein n=1 Tax=Methylotenera sp. TaxID=2051956 RepID=UPI002487AD2E|nr:PIN domain-containing protein [Methylotenera sp.]MDI1298949.1 PIN domain-containing protein [Methylotenera sp.]
MKTNFVLIDYENVQPKLLSALNQEQFRVFIFVGENQSKIPFELVETLQEFGTKAKYIKIDGNGHNALDFHIAFYIGQLAKEEPNSYFHIISRDKGFDPLIKHLKTIKILCARSLEVKDMPLFKALNSSSETERINAVIDNLKQRGSSKPRKEKTLNSTINSLFQKSLSGHELANLIETLKSKKIITIKDGNITYHLED